MQEMKDEIIVEEHTNKNDVVEVKEEAFTDSDIDKMCLKLKQEIKANQNISDKALELAKIIASNSKDYLDNDTYLWTMYTYALKYQKEDNVNAKRFIQIRMKDVIDAMQNKRPKQKALTFISTDFNKDAITHICDETSFMENEIKILGKQFIKLEIVMGIIFFLVLKLLFKYSLILSFGMVTLVLFMNFKLSYKSLVKRYINEQTNACKDYCKDEEIIIFDLPVRNS